MGSNYVVHSLCFGALIGLLGSAGAAPRNHVRTAPPPRSLAGFVENRGQWPAEVLYFGRAGGIEATLTREALVFRPAPDPNTREWPAPVVLTLPGAARVEGAGGLPAVQHFLLGSGVARNVPGFARVRYRDLVPGLDLVVRIAPSPGGQAGAGECFAYDLELQPGARLEDLTLRVTGATAVAAAGPGVLAMTTPAGLVEQRIGRCFQIDPATGAEQDVASGFRRVDGPAGEIAFGFVAPGRDPARAFVLDPSLVWATYVGSAMDDQLKDMAVDAAGAVYLACLSPGAPTTPGALLTSPPPGAIANVWVGKLSAGGASLEWGTFLGGTGGQDPYGIEVDHDGTVVVFGHTWASDFPTTESCLDPLAENVPSKVELFVSRLDPSGSALVWSTYYGGPGIEEAMELALFPGGDVLISAEPEIASPPSTPGAFDTVFDSGGATGQVHDLLLARISADGRSLVFQTYFKAGRILDAVIGADDAIYIAGDLGKEDKPLPSTPGAFKTSSPGTKSDGFVAKLNGLGTQVKWATYLGGEEGSDTVWSIAIDASGAVYAAGQTGSDDFSTTPGAFSTSIAGAVDGFVTKFLPNGTGLAWSTYFGTTCCNGGGHFWDLEVDVAGNVYAVGSANEANLPTTPDAFQPTFIGPFPTSDSFLTKFDAFGGALIYSTWFGGSGTDYFPTVELDPNGGVVVGIQSYSSDAPATPTSFDTSANGGNDMLIAKFELPTLPWRVLAGAKPGGVEVPNLAGDGWLTPGSSGRMVVAGAAPASLALLFAGLNAIDVPALGGTFVPSPDLVVPLATNAAGAIDLPFLWPALPAGIVLHVQVWIADAAAPFGWSATNATQMTSQSFAPP